MIIKLDKIPEQGEHFEGAEPAEVLQTKPSDEFRPHGPLQYNLYAQIVDGMLIVRGTLSAVMEARCARCTQIFSTTVNDSGFLRDYSDLDGVEEVDVTDDLREEILLNFPRFPLCDEGCKGLCPLCGVDLNTGSCECAKSESGGAWDALNNLNL